MKSSAWDLLQLNKRHRDGSIATQKDRHRMLQLSARQLETELGYRKMRARSLKPKHVLALIKHWQGQRITEDTIRNRVSVLRWWAEKIDKHNIVPKRNTELGICRRGNRYLNKAVSLTDAKLQKIGCPYIRASLKLQAAFSLRREEAMKVCPVETERDDKLVLKGSWCKGGRVREIPVQTSAQRTALENTKHLTNSGSLIPAQKSYKTHLMSWKKQTARAGLSRTHGLRHAYAQRRYHELTGRSCPAAGGTRTGSLSLEQQAENRGARQVIAEELGHGRLEITYVYLGK